MNRAATIATRSRVVAGRLRFTLEQLNMTVKFYGGSL